MTRKKAKAKTRKKPQKSPKKPRKKAKKQNNKKNSYSTARLLIWISIFTITVCILVREFYFNTSYDVLAHNRAYKHTKLSIHQKRLTFEQEWKTAPHKQSYLKQSAKNYLYETLTDSIFPYWYGTPWDFNGTTQYPLQGKIACGYFVTTTLSHLGFELPRVKMAQQAASRIIRSLCPKSSIKTFNKIGLLKKHLDQHPQGIFIVGLDTHVGFLWQSAKGLYFVHSSYSGNKQVSKEPWNQSIVLNKSKLFVVGNLLDNPILINTWILGKNIAISK